MCLEIYSPSQAVQISYELERVRFVSPQAIHSRYTLLVRNAGYQPINRLIILYPRPLSRPVQQATEGAGVIWVSQWLPNHTVTDITAQLREIAPFVGTLGPDQMLTASIPDPNNPVGFLHGISGYWYPGNAHIRHVPRLTARCYLLLYHHGFAAFEMTLAKPIQPRTGQWLSLEFTADGLGTRLGRTPLGSVVFHELASPIDVRRTIGEAFQTALRDLHMNHDDMAAETVRLHDVAYRTILFELGLNQERRVDIQYYELGVQTGPPGDLFLVNSTIQGDIRLRSGSPRIGQDPQLDGEFLGEPVYEWKSGSMIEPVHPWRNSGFSVRLTLAHREQRVKRKNR